MSSASSDARPTRPRRHWTYARISGAVVVVLGTAAGVVALYLIRDVLLLFLVAVLLATAIEPLVFRLRRGPFSRGQGVLIVYSGIMLVIAAIGALIIPIVLAEMGGFSETYPRALDQIRTLVYGIEPEVLGPAAEEAVAQAAAPPAPADKGSTALAVGTSLAEGAFAALTVFMVAYYWLTERVQIKRAFTSVFPRDHRVTVGKVWNEVEEVLGGWGGGQLILMLSIGVAAAIGYTLLGVKHALVLALLAGLLEIVPILGPYLGAIPAILVALTQDVWLAVYVALFNLVIQVVEGNVLVPRIMEKTVGVSSLTVVLGLLVGAALGGIPGALVAIPLAAAAQVILKHVVLLDPDAAPEDVAAREAVVASTAADLGELPVRQGAPPSPSRSTSS
jgi:predicted PurR-regulated permease PerM